jgi:hypothetical protein
MLEINTEIIEKSELSVSDMAAYLREHGWKELPGENKHLIVFQGINDDFDNPLMLILPRQDESDNALRYISQAVEMIAFLENKPLERILSQIKSFVYFHSHMGSSPDAIKMADTLSRIPRQSISQAFNFKVEVLEDVNTEALSPDRRKL